MTANPVPVGKLVEDDDAGRDAIHIAIAPVKAATLLLPGQVVGFMGGDTTLAYPGGRHVPRIGIVDPFLRELVHRGERFWLFLYPNTVTSLRHQWTHPSFPDEPAAQTKRALNEREEAEVWIARFAIRINQSLPDLRMAATRYVDDGDITFVGDNESYNDVDGSEWQEFWRCWKIIHGKSPTMGSLVPFSCAC